MSFLTTVTTKFFPQTNLILSGIEVCIRESQFAPKLNVKRKLFFFFSNLERHLSNVLNTFVQMLLRSFKNLCMFSFSTLFLIQFTE